MVDFAHLGEVEGFNQIATPISRTDPGNANKDGLQEAHIQGARLYNRDLVDLRAQIDPFGVGSSEMATNGVLAPETKPGSLALRVTTHSGQQLTAFDDLSYEVNNPDGDQFLSGLRKDVKSSVDILEARLADPVNSAPEAQAAIRQQIDEVRLDGWRKMQAYNDFLSMHLLDQGLLDDISAEKFGGEKLFALDFNAAGTQGGTTAFGGQSAADYLRSQPVKDYFKFDNVLDNPMFQDMVARREALGPRPGEAITADSYRQTMTDLSVDIIRDYPDAARMRYPLAADGKPQILWDDDVRADILASHYFAHRNPEDAQKIINIRNTSEYAQIKSAILEDLQNPNLYADGKDKPITFDQYAQDRVGYLSTPEHRREGAEKLNQVLDNMEALDSNIFDFREPALKASFDEMRASINAVRNSTTISFDGKSTHALSAVGILFGIIALDTKYRAETVDDPKSFGAWLAEKSPEALAILPATIVVAGGFGASAIGLAALGPAGWAILAGMTAAAAYPAVKEFLQNYVIAYENDPEANFVATAKLVLTAMDWFEGTWAYKAAAAVVNLVVDNVITPIFEALTPELQLVTGEGVGKLPEGKSSWLIGDDVAEIEGNESANVLFHIGAGEVRGLGGDDIIVGFNPQVIEIGEKIGKPPTPGSEDTRTVSDRVHQQVLDGGQGDDWVITFVGERAITVGGEGRDWIFNTSAGGIIYGDTQDRLDSNGNELKWDQTATDPETGDEYYAHADKIWFWGGTTMMDPTKADRLAFFGYPLVGGTNDLGSFFGQLQGTPVGAGLTLASTANPFYFDYFVPFMVYHVDSKTQTLQVANMLSLGLGGLFFGMDTDAGDHLPYVMTFNNYDEAAVTYWGLDIAARAIYTATTGDSSYLSDMGMIFKKANPALAIFSLIPGFPGGFNRMLPMIDDLMMKAGATILIAKSLGWSVGADPLLLDLDGDGIETIGIDDADVWFDLDGDLFAEKTGWLKGDDGFLVRDVNRDGKITDINEMFGGPGQSALGDLAQYDANGDGKITAADAIYAELKVWRDRDGDGATDAGEMISLADIGIVEISVQGTALNVTTPQGTQLAARADFVWSTGQVGRAFDAIFEMNDVDTKFNGNAGIAGWLGDHPINARGFGEVADLAVAMSNDPALAIIMAEAAASMDVPEMRDMRAKTAEALGQWGMTLDQTRELMAVKVGADGKLADHAVWVEDAPGAGYWRLESGTAVLAADGAVIARPTLEQILAQGTDWRLEQGFSPSTRGTAVLRDEMPYLTKAENGRVVVLDYGIEQADGSWRLASGRSVIGADGQPIAAPTKADILAMPAAAGQAWQVEEIGFNPLANLSVDEIGVMSIDGKVVDYTVQVTDAEGTFLVWARNLDQALEKQFRDGNAFGYNLRAKEVILANLDITESDEESGKRIELLTPGQFNFATELSGVEFNPAMLTATWNRASGTIAYSVNGSGSASLDAQQWDSAVEGMIDLLDPVMDQYIIASRAFALRVGFQGGLSEFFPGMTCSPETSAL